ncbi:MAG: hydroxyethylthiazole kinase [Clostridiales bacterium]|nr:hydroxyethylthiazole kinase [Clostridiales bacterium]
MWKELLENVRTCAPRIHCITNYVSMNDCANILLACGASPIMAMDEAETAQITAACDGLTINIGTLSRTVIPAMLSSGRRANELGIPVVLDPVGAGASDFRTKSALLLLQEIHFTAIRGNASELRALAAALRGTDEQRMHTLVRPESDGANVCAAFAQKETADGGDYACGMVGAIHSSGVDVGASDRVTEENLDQWITFVKDFSRRTKAVVALTGAIDIVADAHSAFIIRNGHPMMSRVTGTGCQLSVLLAAFLAANGSKDSRADTASGTAGDMRADAAREYADGMHTNAARECADGMHTNAARECADGRHTNAAKKCVDDMHTAAMSGDSKNLQAAAAAVCAMGVCGEKAQKRLTALDGNATYRNYLIDAVSHLSPEDLEQEANYEMR